MIIYRDYISLTKLGKIGEKQEKIFWLLKRKIYIVDYCDVIVGNESGVFTAENDM